MTKTTVVHVLHCPGATPIDRRTVFGNPFIIGRDGTREEVIELYKDYFYERLSNDPDFKEAVDDLNGDVLGCWCKPLPCHGDVIAEYLNGS
jgi:hypothetical protein